jgi:predicted transcriptional regulator
VDDRKPDQNNAHIAAIAAAYLGNPSNPVEPGKIGEVIREIGAALSTPAQPSLTIEPEPPKPSPAAIRKSITRDHLISFIDSKPYKSLSRHLGAHGLTPATYRERFGLKPDYPMVSPGYSEFRAALAHKAGFGRRPQAAPAAAPAPVELPAVPAAPVEAPKTARAAKAAAPAKATGSTRRRAATQVADAAPPPPAPEAKAPKPAKPKVAHAAKRVAKPAAAAADATTVEAKAAAKRGASKPVQAARPTKSRTTTRGVRI